MNGQVKDRGRDRGSRSRGEWRRWIERRVDLIIVFVESVWPVALVLAAVWLILRSRLGRG